MTEEVSKRIDDLHKRFDDLRGDINRRFDDVNRRFDDLQGDANRRFEAVDRRFDEVVTELRELRADMRAHFRWTVTTMVALFGLAVPIWMWFLTLILKLR
jgi:hypothetical protein